LPVRIIDHARERMAERDVTEEEVLECLSSGLILDAKGERKAKEAVFPFNSHWRGRYCEQKKVRVIYVEEGPDTVVITVYSFFGHFEAER